MNSSEPEFDLPVALLGPSRTGATLDSLLDGSDCANPAVEVG